MYKSVVHLNKKGYIVEEAMTKARVEFEPFALFGANVWFASGAPIALRARHLRWREESTSEEQYAATHQVRDEMTRTKAVMAREPEYTAQLIGNCKSCVTISREAAREHDRLS